MPSSDMAVALSHAIGHRPLNVTCSESIDDFARQHGHADFADMVAKAEITAGWRSKDGRLLCVGSDVWRDDADGAGEVIALLEDGMVVVNDGAKWPNDGVTLRNNSGDYWGSIRSADLLYATRDAAYAALARGREVRGG